MSVRKRVRKRVRMRVCVSGCVHLTCCQVRSEIPCTQKPVVVDAQTSALSEVLLRATRLPLHLVQYFNTHSHTHTLTLTHTHIHTCTRTLQKLEVVSNEDLTSALSEILPHASSLMTDVFGNYVMQKFLEHGSQEMREQVAGVLQGQVCGLGCECECACGVGCGDERASGGCASEPVVWAWV